MRNRLIEQRERVAHRALRSTRDQRERLRLDRNDLLLGNAGEVLD